MTKKAEKAAQVAANKKAAWIKGLRILTGHIFARIPGIDAAYEAGRSYEDFAAEVASKEPVGAALNPRKADAIECAAQEAQKRINRIYADLMAHDWDIRACAPYPDSLRVSREKYLSMRDKHNLYSALTQSDKSRAPAIRRNDPDYRTGSPSGAERYINNAKQDAAFQYDAFICKMVLKIGEGAHAASIEGNHIWGNSILTVEMLDGTDQIWHTQQIWNTSSLGKVFPQWPSRLQK